MQELKDQNLYYGRPSSELVFVRVSEHKKLHMTGNAFRKGVTLSEETRQKMSVSHKGKRLSIEHRQKMSESHKGKNTWQKGTHWWNDGISSKCCKERPGEGWHRGRIILRKKSHTTSSS